MNHVKLLVISTAVAGAIAGCGSAGSAGPGGGSSPGSQSTLVIAAVDPFTGPDADFGPSAMAGCVPAVALINHDGGALGHDFTCKTVDTRGDPADAVPALTQLLATTSNLAAIVGPTSDETDALAPIINSEKIPFDTSSGEDSLDHDTWPYYYRMTVSDGTDGTVMALRAHQRGFKRAALIYGSDIGSQGTVPFLKAGLQKLGSPTIAIFEAVALDQTSYRTEIERMLAAKPDVILTETDGPTMATFESELLQLHGSLLPVITSGAGVEPTYCRSINAAIGSKNMVTYFEATNTHAASTGSAWQVYKTTLMAHASEVKDAQTDIVDDVAQGRYNFVNLVALGMIEAKSADPAKYNRYIVSLTQPKPGAVKVGTFAAGKSALLAGKPIQYVGMNGSISWGPDHNAIGAGDEIDHCLPGGQGNIAQEPGTPLITAPQIVALQK